MQRDLRGAVPDRRSVRLLEVGCGPGGNVWYMAREGYQVSGDGSAVAMSVPAAAGASTDPVAVIEPAAAAGAGCWCWP